MDPTVVVIIGIIVLLVLMFAGMNVGAVMFFVGFVGYALIVNFDAAIGILRTAPMAQAMKYSFSVIPLFTLMGNACFAAGLSQGLYDFCRKWLSRVPGSVACATIGASARRSAASCSMHRQTIPLHSLIINAIWLTVILAAQKTRSPSFSRFSSSTSKTPFPLARAANASATRRS